MSLVDLRASPTADPLVGWKLGEDLVARASLRRSNGDLELLSVSADDPAHAVAMVQEIIRVASAPRIVTSLTETWLSEQCGFVGGSLDLSPQLADLPVSVTLSELEGAIVASWGPDTAPLLWSAANPSRGQCGVTALVVQEFLGGSILSCNVVMNGRRIERHAWNELPSGLVIDLTRRQFDGVDGVAYEAAVRGQPHEVENLSARAAILSARVRARLAERTSN